MIDLYTSPTPNGHKISCALEAMDLDYNAILVNLMEGEQHKPEFVKISPIGKIPEIQPWLEEIETDGRANENSVWEAMKTCYDPEIPVNIVDLGLIYDCVVTPIEEGNEFNVLVKMTLTAPGCGMGPVIQQDVQNKVMCIEDVAQADVELVWEPQWSQDMMTEAARLQLGLM